MIYHFHSPVIMTYCKIATWNRLSFEWKRQERLAVIWPEIKRYRPSFWCCKLPVRVLGIAHYQRYDVRGVLGGKKQVRNF